MPAIKKNPDDDYDESWVATAAYIHTTKGLFPISVLKAAERKEERRRARNSRKIRSGSSRTV